MKTVVLGLLLFVHGTNAASCGSSAVPFSFEVLPDGSTVLGCARPSCLGWDAASGQPASNDAAFDNVNNRPDGFFRDGSAQRTPFDPNHPNAYPQQTAQCAPSLTGQCAPGEWVSGLQPSGANAPLSLQCCSHMALSQAVDRGIASVNPGQVVIGGEADGAAGQSFDYISSMTRRVLPNGQVTFDVGVGRFPCYEVPAAAPIFNQAQGFAQAQAFAPPPQVLQPVQAPSPVYYAPAAAAASSSSNGGYAGLGGYYCFSADTMVRTLNGNEKRMDQLEKNDWVQSMNNQQSMFVPVTMWLHRMPSQTAKFNRIELADGSSLKLTSKHYIYKASCDKEGQQVNYSELSVESVFADAVKVNDCLYRVSEDGVPTPTRVTDVSIVEEKGIYAPMTANGKLIVNGIYASCHNIVQSHTLHNSFFGYLEHINSMFYTVSPSSLIRDLPSGMETLMTMMDYALPKNLVNI